jgi:phosphohistidine phosphatase
MRGRRTVIIVTILKLNFALPGCDEDIRLSDERNHSIKRMRQAMKTLRHLILWRHAKSAWDNPSHSDFERELAPRGVEAAPKMAAWIAANWPPDTVWCSPAARTVRTWQALAPLLPAQTPIAFDARLYEARSRVLLEVLQQTSPDAECVLLIGHNPGLETLTSTLARPLRRKFATAAAAVLAFQGEWAELEAGRASLEKFRRPRKPKSVAPKTP